MSRKSWKTPAVSMVLGILAATSACGSDGDQPSTDNPVTVFDGTYTQTITADDNVPTYLIGTIDWTWDDGTYRVTFRDDENLWVSGSYDVDGNKLTITEEDGPRKCAAGTETATYFWSVDGDQLELASTEQPDLCEGRKDAVPAVPFVR